MKRLLKIGDVVRISAKNKEYADLTYEVRIVEVSDKMAKGRQVMYDGSISMLGYYSFNKNYDTEDLVAKPYGKDPFNQWDRIVIPRYEEVWRECWRYENYEVSTLGKVRNKKTKKVLKTTLSTNGKPQVNLTLSKDWKERIGIAQLVCRTFLPKVLTSGKEKLMVQHKDKDASNNSLENLWIQKIKLKDLGIDVPTWNDDEPIEVEVDIHISKHEE